MQKKHRTFNNKERIHSNSKLEKNGQQ